MGPTLIFDKSVLQGLNPDEAMWMDNFFLSNITPLFFIETLADLEKEVRAGRTPEDVVGNLAYKTPDMSSRPNVHHTILLEGELTGAGEVEMQYGRPIISGGQVMELGGKTGIMFQQTPEEEAFNRWRNKEFLELERTRAKAWRRGLSNIDLEENYTLFQTFFPLGKPKNLADVKRFVDFYIEGPDQQSVLIFGLSLLGISSEAQSQIVARWRSCGTQTVKKFAPYFTYVFSVDFFFYLAIAADLIGRGRPSHKIDLAYLYYLPFCMVFTSNDKLHADLAPFFLREDQTFVTGSDLKAGLAELDKHYDALPDEVKERGVYSFASQPPDDDSFLITKLWDKHMSPTWRTNVVNTKPDTEDKIAQHIIDEMRRFKEEGTPIMDDSHVSSDHADHLVIQRSVIGKKGKWVRFPPEVMNRRKSDKGE